MPLNDNNNPDAQQSSAPVYQPILHKPGKDYSLLKNIALASVILLSVAGAVYFTYTQLSMSNSDLPRQEIALMESEPVDAPIRDDGFTAGTTGGISTTPAEVPERREASSGEMTPASRIKDDLSGRYTIYVASLAGEAEANAARLRWRKDGFNASVIEAKGRYRVAVGRFNTEASARKFVTENSAKFGKDFWISKTPR